MDSISTQTPDAAGRKPQRVPIDEFVDGIRAISSGIITKKNVSEFLATHPIDPESLEPYKSWEPDRHTRNLIFRNEMIEMMLICWNVGNITPLHTHNGQLGWMEMVEGRLIVENYRLLSCNKPENQEVVGIDCLAGATQIEMEKVDEEMCQPGGALNTVDKHHTIHRIINRAEWKQPAVSLHLYAQPITSCVVFDLDEQRCFRRNLKYDTVPDSLAEYR